MAEAATQPHLAFVAFAGTGHLNPIVPILGALRAAGWRVTILSTADVHSNAALFAKAGVAPEDMLTWREPGKSDAEAAEETWPLKRFVDDAAYDELSVIGRWMLSDEAILPWIIDTLRARSVTFVMYDTFSAAGCIAAEYLHLPNAATITYCGPGLPFVLQGDAVAPEDQPERVEALEDALPRDDGGLIMACNERLKDAYGVDLLGTRPIVRWFSRHLNLVVCLKELGVVQLPFFDKYEVCRTLGETSVWIGASITPKGKEGQGNAPMLLRMSSLRVDGVMPAAIEHEKEAKADAAAVPKEELDGEEEELDGAPIDTFQALASSISHSITRDDHDEEDEKEGKETTRPEFDAPFPLDDVRAAHARGKHVVFVSPGTVVTTGFYDLELPADDDPEATAEDVAKAQQMRFGGKSSGRRLLHALFRALASSSLANQEGVIVVISIGPKLDAWPTDVPIPANFVVRRRVPQVQVLEVCDVFASHMGFNSTLESVIACCPMVAIPYFSDQYANARIAAQRHGFGLYPTHEPARHPDLVVGAVTRLLADASLRDQLRAAARALHPAFAAAGGVPAAVAAIERAHEEANGLDAVSQAYGNWKRVNRKASLEEACA